ncbi:MAG: glycosyltransferase [Sedimentisphaerales bacterium]|nr:glycosyltransferase [Sedimentisphaerales bacterium]
MKIAYIVSSLKISMTFVVNELEAHEKAGWQVLPLVSCKPGPLENLSEVMVKWNKRAVHRPGFLAQIGATLKEIITHPIRFGKVLFWLATLLLHSPIEFAKALYELTACCCFTEECRGFGAEHIHVHFASRSLSLGLMMGMLTDLPVSCTVHAFDIFTRSPGSLTMRLSKCKSIASISQFNVEYLRKKCDNSISDLCRVVHCGIDAEKFSPVSHQPESGRIVCVCRLSAKKGLDVAIRACAKLRDNNVKFIFEIAGDGPQRRDLEELIERLHLSDKVKLLGAKPNDQLGGLFSRASVFLMPCVKTSDGDMDGIPVAMMEAMACEVPVVSTTISGIPELVEDGVTGRLAPEKDVDALAQILQELLEDMDKIEQFGKAGRQRVLTDFCISENAAKLRELIKN